MKRGNWLIKGILLIPLTACGGGSSVAGESCAKTADCAEGLRCVELTCKTLAEIGKLEAKKAAEKGAEKKAREAAEEKEAALSQLQEEIQEMERKASALEDELAGATSKEERERLLTEQAKLRDEMKDRRKKRRGEATADPLGGL